MPFFGALTMALALAAGAGDARLLFCRPQVTGDAALARGDAVVEAGRRMPRRFLDYGVACEDAAEGARAARRAGLAYAIATSAEGRVEGSRYVLVLADASTEGERARRALDVAPGADAAPPIRAALRQLLGSLPPRPGPRPAHVAAWSIAGAGAAALVAATVFALQSRERGRPRERRHGPRVVRPAQARTSSRSGRSRVHRSARAAPRSRRVSPGGSSSEGER